MGRGIVLFTIITELRRALDAARRCENLSCGRACRDGLAPAELPHGGYSTSSMRIEATPSGRDRYASGGSLDGRLPRRGRRRLPDDPEKVLPLYSDDVSANSHRPIEGYLLEHLTCRPSIALQPAKLSLIAGALMAAVLLSGDSAASAQMLALPGSAAEARAKARTARALPPPTRGTRPYQAHAFGVCADSICTYDFGKVSNDRLLEVNNVSCLVGVLEIDINQFGILSTTDDRAGTGLIAIVPAEQLLARGSERYVIINSAGPYFFKADDSVYIVTGGTLGRCTISGRISRID